MNELNNSQIHWHAYEPRTITIFIKRHANNERKFRVFISSYLRKKLWKLVFLIAIMIVERFLKIEFPFSQLKS